MTSERDDLQLIREHVARLCSNYDDTYWAACDSEHRFPWAFYRDMAAGGWIGIAIPEQYGGGGRGIVEAAAVLEEVAASGAAMNGASALHMSIFGMQPVIRHGSEQMRRRFLPAVADGSLHVAFGVTEPDAGTDTSRITTRAVRDGDHYVITGRKVWTSKALEAHRILLLTRTTPLDQCRRPTDGMTLFLVDKHSPGVGVAPIPKMGRNAVASCETTYDQVVVPVADRVGEEGEGFRYLLDGLNAERVLIAAEAVGIGRVALDRAVAYAKQRVVFGRPIGQNQGIAFPLAEAHARLRAANLMVQEAARLVDAGVPCGEEANLAKYLAAEAGFFAADRAVQTLGGFGYATEYHVERYFREARLMRIAPISQELIMSYIAEHVLGLPRSY
ncbi:MAG: acyl-CoA dehydrogenase family protein [Ilumatobacteraceae bacterium]|nr:acyl-CoA dehydrogenase family protein [Ilumatobacteraceae bacterium]HRA82702.1 acyl-CoA dehydrogenase family protein [Ilumatobacteraceae bacterium]